MEIDLYEIKTVSLKFNCELAQVLTLRVRGKVQLSCTDLIRKLSIQKAKVVSTIFPGLKLLSAWS